MDYWASPQNVTPERSRTPFDGNGTPLSCSTPISCQPVCPPAPRKDFQRFSSWECERELFQKNLYLTKKRKRSDSKRELQPSPTPERLSSPCTTDERFYSKNFVELGNCHHSVFQTRNKIDGVEYAVKRSLCPPAENPIYREQMALAVFSGRGCKNIVRFHHAWVENEDGHLYTQLEYCTDGNLLDYSKKKLPFSESEIVNILSQMATALKDVHSCELVHSDLKPEHILISGDVFKLGGFNLVKRIDCRISTTEKPDSRYVAPEATEPEHLAKPWNDIFSLGLTLYCLLLNGGEDDLPSEGTEEWNLLRKNEITFPQKISPALECLLRLMLEQIPENRPSSDEILNVIRAGIIDQLLLDQLLKSKSKVRGGGGGGSSDVSGGGGGGEGGERDRTERAERAERAERVEKRERGSDCSSSSVTKKEQNKRRVTRRKKGRSPMVTRKSTRSLD